MLESKESQSED